MEKQHISTNGDIHTTREELHFRRLDFRGFRRSDGLFEIEARLTDRKPHDFRPPSGERMIGAGEAIHDHHLRVVFDTDMVIRQMHASMHSYPYAQCPQGGDVLQAMVGARIGAGWSQEVRRRLPPGETCTHLREMLLPLATAAIQAMHTQRAPVVATDAGGRPLKIDSCYAYGASRELVRQLWPDFHEPSAAP